MLFAAYTGWPKWHIFVRHYSNTITNIPRHLKCVATLPCEMSMSSSNN